MCPLSLVVACVSGLSNGNGPLRSTCGLLIAKALFLLEDHETTASFVVFVSGFRVWFFLLSIPSWFPLLHPCVWGMSLGFLSGWDSIGYSLVCGFALLQQFIRYRLDVSVCKTPCGVSISMHFVHPFRPIDSFRSSGFVFIIVY